MRISDWSSDVCSSDLPPATPHSGVGHAPPRNTPSPTPEITPRARTLTRRCHGLTHDRCLLGPMGSGIGGPIVGRLLEVGSPDAQFEGLGARLGAEIAIAKLRQRNCKARFDHGLAQIYLPCGAAGDDPVIVVDIALLTLQFSTIDQLRQFRDRK